MSSRCECTDVEINYSYEHHQLPTTFLLLTSCASTRSANSTKNTIITTEKHAKVAEAQFAKVKSLEGGWFLVEGSLDTP